MFGRSYRSPGFHVPVVDKQFRPYVVNKPGEVLTMEVVF